MVEDDDGDYVYHVYLKDKEVFVWYDNAHYDYPEDLTWDRTIADVFYSGVEVGKQIQLNRNR